MWFDTFMIRGISQYSLSELNLSVEISVFTGLDWYTVRVDLTVMDVNDNAPEWTMVPFPFLSVVSADVPPNIVVYKLQARDGDEGINGEVEYFLSDGKHNFHLPSYFISMLITVFIHLF